jgi:undecaprenyl-phosphate 4-deoxy-4-formamido-L-arabinose transferase
VTLVGLATAGGGFLFGFYQLGRRLITGPDPSQGVFTLFAVLFLFVGLLFVALGLIGEYICRIYLEVRRAPAFRIQEIVSQEK